MILFPNAKINLGLSVTGKRADGYHNIETVFYPVPLEDALEIESCPQGNGQFVLNLYGKAIQGKPEDNLVVKAYLLLQKEYQLPPIIIHLYKHIPTEAGLGGGSADAAFMLKLLNNYFSLGLPAGQLEEYAAHLGADCAFFIRNTPVFAEGIGNIFTPVSLSLQGYQVLIVKPDVAVSTRDAFSNIRPHKPVLSAKEAVKRPIEEWKNLLYNDFESSIFPQFPIIQNIKQLLYENGAVYASMSGSGSSVYGIFKNDAPIPDIDFGSKVFLFKGQLSGEREHADPL